MRDVKQVRKLLSQLVSVHLCGRMNLENEPVYIFYLLQEDIKITFFKTFIQT